MFRFILYIVIAFLLWRFIQAIVSPARRAGRHTQPPVTPTPPRGKMPPTFTDVKDAEFEDLPKKGPDQPPAGG